MSEAVRGGYAIMAHPPRVYRETSAKGMRPLQNLPARSDKQSRYALR